jgi:hypothetical protein
MNTPDFSKMVESITESITAALSDKFDIPEMSSRPEPTDQDLMREQIRNDVLRFAVTQLDPTKRDDVELLANIYAATR